MTTENEENATPSQIIQVADITWGPLIYKLPLDGAVSPIFADLVCRAFLTA